MVCGSHDSQIFFARRIHFWLASVMTLQPSGKYSCEKMIMNPGDIKKRKINNYRTNII